MRGPLKVAVTGPRPSPGPRGPGAERQSCPFTCGRKRGGLATSCSRAARARGRHRALRKPRQERGAAVSTWGGGLGTRLGGTGRAFSRAWGTRPHKSLQAAGVHALLGKRAAGREGGDGRA